ncbi:hypothetical protein Goshw_020489 [Gossypium schwendimanii]|uniref:UBC core domain-containing protein n=1 Tax=Gossypium schwendimanii TaxID=34291 RepID=A0A7J9LPV5_GOSSC|nr:hypothetical protein [Gossypium schwendimanii]
MDDGDDIYMRSWTGTIIGPLNVGLLIQRSSDFLQIGEGSILWRIY